MTCQRPSPLRARRLLRGVRIRDVGNATGISDCYLSELERGERALRGRLLRALAAYYATAPERLVEEMDRWTGRRTSAAAGDAKGAP